MCPRYIEMQPSMQPSHATTTQYIKAMNMGAMYKESAWRNVEVLPAFEKVCRSCEQDSCE